MTGFTSAGIWKPFCWSQVSSAAESVFVVGWSCTVAYGPTFSCLVTVTPPGLVLSLLAPAACGPPPPKPPQLLGGAGHVEGGGLICVAVSWSTEPKSTSALRPTSTVPWIGKTHAKEPG